MIKYDLVCEGGHEFDVWFRDMAACDAQLGRGIVTCPVCAGTKVSKAIMAPAVARRDREDLRASLAATARQQRQALRELRRKVEENCTYVGDRFAEEARRIHYGEADQQDIWGEASLAEARELTEEGIDVLPLPDLPHQDS